MPRLGIAPSLLPALDEIPPTKLHFRWVANGLLSSVVLPRDILTWMVGFYAASTVNCFGLIQAARIKRIRIVDTTGQEIQLVWQGGPVNSGVGSEIQKSAVGNVIYPSQIDMTPPKNSGAAFWISTASTTSTVFTITPGGVGTTFVDIWFEAKFGGQTAQYVTSNTSPTAATIAFTGLTLGSSNFLSLMTNPIT